MNKHGTAVNFCSVCRSESLCVQDMKKFIAIEKFFIFSSCVWEGLLVYRSFQMKDKHHNLFNCKMCQIKSQEMQLLTIIVVTITVLFSMPDVSLGSKAWSWVRTNLSASFQYPIWRWDKDKNETPDPTESKLIHASLPTWVNVWKVFCLNRAKQLHFILRS